jgi:hypothetical protein
MWITPRLRETVRPFRDRRRVMPKGLCPSAPNMWIIHRFLMIYSLLFAVISKCYRIINSCGECIGFITPHKVPRIGYFAHMSPPRRVAAACGQIVD